MPFASHVYGNIPTRYALPVLRRTIGDNLKELRGTLTQEEFAAKAGVRQGEISKWERGKQEPTVQSLLQMAVRLRKPLDVFVHDINQEYEDLRAQQKREGTNAALETRVHDLESIITDYEAAIGKVQNAAGQLTNALVAADDVRTRGKSATSRKAETSSRKRDRKAG